MLCIQTALQALGTPAVKPGETLPLDGVDMWSTVLANGTSPRTEIYYGINQAGQGPAVRDVAGHKLILSHSGGGGGKGEWSPEQSVHASHLHK